MIINKKRDKQDISKIIERFKEDKNPKLSLFIAKHYYTNKEYYRAYNYALTTNKLNPNLEDSWIIFVKSLYKLDQVDRAISTLQTYTKHSDSQKAEILLIQFKEGKFE
jgi:predicted Zn-dependent protease